jgi:hypothetical protein
MALPIEELAAELTVIVDHQSVPAMAFQFSVCRVAPHHDAGC